MTNLNVVTLKKRSKKESAVDQAAAVVVDQTLAPMAKLCPQAVKAAKP